MAIVVIMANVSPEGRDCLSCSHTALLSSIQQMLNKKPVNVQVGKLRGRKELTQGPPPRAEPAPVPALLQPVSQEAPSFPTREHTRAQALCSLIQHSLLLNCTFTFTQTISKSWKSVGWGLGEGQVPPGARTPGWRPRTRAGEGASGCSISGHQLSTCTRTASQQLLTHKYRHA